MGSSQLSDDILDRIFIFLPDFSTLSVLRQTSKAFNQVFTSHPHSIIRAVCYNIIGPALPQAIRAARYPRIYNSPWPLEDVLDESSPISPISPEEIQRLRNNATAVKYFEDRFSVMFNDRTSSANTLNSAESLRFQRAMYRLMLYSNVFAANDFLRREGFRADDDYDVEEVRKEFEQRKKFLSNINTSDLYEMHSVSRFLLEIVRWIAFNDFSLEPIEEGLNDYVLARGPYDLWEVCTKYGIYGPDLCEYRDELLNYKHEGPPVLLRNYLSQPLKMLWEERSAQLPVEDWTHWGLILDTVPSPRDNCRQCNREFDMLDLFCEASWNLRYGVFDARLSETNMLPGTLCSSLVDGPIYRTILEELRKDGMDPLADYDQTKILHEMHELRVGPFDNWNKEDLLCGECIRTIIRFHFCPWFFDQKRKLGHTIPTENCWYGWWCNTQMHNENHAKRLNASLVFARLA